MTKACFQWVAFARLDVLIFFLTVLFLFAPLIIVVDPYESCCNVR